jgi:hypothetical protein
MFGGQTQLLRDGLFIETGRVQGLITSEWVYIRWQDGFEELYNRQADPHNLYNLALRPENAFVCRRLAARMTVERGDPSDLPGGPQ